MANSNLELALKIKAAVDGLGAIQSLISEIEDLGGSAGAAGERGQQLAAELNKLTSQTQLIEEFKKLKTGAGDAAKQLEVAQTNAQKLGKQLAATENPTKQLSAQFEKARANVVKLKQAAIDQGVALQKLRGDLAAAGVNTTELASEQLRIKAAAAEAQKGIAQLDAELRQTRDEAKKNFHDPTTPLREGAKETESAFQRLRNRIGSVATRIALYAGAFAGFEAAKRSLTDLVQTGAEMQTLRKQLDSLTGSALEGEKAFKWIRQFAKDTPFEIEGVTKAYITLKNFGLDPTNGTMQAVADQAAQLGGKQETLTGITLALGQAWARGRLQGQDILQLINQGVPVYELLSKVTGQTTAAVQKMSEAGTIGRDVMLKFIQAMGSSAKGASAAQIDTFTGQLSNLRDNITQLEDTISRAGFLDFLKEKLAGLNQTLSDMADNGSLQTLAQSISDKLKSAGESVISFAKTIYDLRAALGFALEAWLAFKAFKLGAWFVEAGLQIKNFLIPALMRSNEEMALGVTRAGKFGAALKRIPANVKVSFAILGITAAIAVAKKFGDQIQALKKDALLNEYADEAAKVNTRLINIANSRAQALKEFAGVEAKNAADLKRMTLDQLKAYNDRLTGAQRLTAYELEAMKIVGGNTDELATKLENLKTSQAAVDAMIKATAADMANGLTPAVKALIGQFDAVAAHGTKVKDALKGLLDGLDVGSSTSVANIFTALDKIEAQGKATGAAIQAALADRLKGLSADDFPRLETAAQAAFGAVGGNAKTLAAVMNASLHAQLAALGVDLTKVETGISTAGTAAIETFRSIASNGAASGDAVAAAFAAALGKVSSSAGLNALKAALIDAGNTGKLSADQVSAGIAALDAKLQKAAGDATLLNQALAAINGAGTTAALQAASAQVDALYLNGKISAQQYAQAVDTAVKKEQALGDAAAATGAKVATANEAQTGLLQQIAANTENLQKHEVELQNFAAVLTNSVNAGRAEFAALSDTAARAYDQMVKDATVSGESVELFIKKFAAGLDRLRGVAKEQQDEAAQLIQSLGTVGNQTARDVLLAQQAIKNNQYLGQEQLSGLQAALDRVNNEMQTLRDNSASTLSSLKDQLDQLEGNEADIAQRAYQQQTAQLQAQLKEAQALNDQQSIANLTQALDLAKQIYDQKIAGIRADQRAAKQQQQTQRPNNVTPLQTPAAQKQVTVKLVGVNSQTVSGQFDEADAQALIDLLQQAGLSAAG